VPKRATGVNAKIACGVYSVYLVSEADPIASRGKHLGPVAEGADSRTPNSFDSR
jgi:hypothetical protein